MSVINCANPNPLWARLVCTRCQSDLQQQDEELICTACSHAIPLIDGIPRFIELTSGELDEDHPIEHRQKYEKRYQSAELAQGYNDSFIEIPRDQKRTVRELDILNSMLSSMAHCETILDIPCGGGRLSPPLAAKTDNLFEMDASLEQVKLAIKVTTHDTPRFGASASALALPLADQSVDATLDARLSHHLPDIKERAQLLDEILRVSRRFVIFTFTDKNSTHSFYRKLRGKQANPAAMAVSEIESAAARHGARLEQLQTVFKLGSRHRFALICR